MPSRSDLDRQHAQTVKRLLLAESAASRLIKQPVSAATARVQASTALAIQPSRHIVLSAIRHESSRLRQDVHGAVIQSRLRARDIGKEQLAADLAPVRRWASENFRAQPPPPGIIEHAAALDAFEAERVASSLQTVWSSAMLNGFNRWDKAGGTGNIARALDVGRILEPRLDVHAATQAAGAYADERQSYWDNLAESADDGGSFFGGLLAANDDGDKPNSSPLFHVWSALLDGSTCSACEELDGVTVPIDEEFPDGATTPLQPKCRCSILTTFDEDALDGTDNRQAVGDQVKSATLPSIMRQF